MAVHARSGSDAQQTVDEIFARGGRAAPVGGDLGDREDVRRIIPEAGDRLGPLSLLVNSASLFQDDRLGALDEARWDAHFATNLYAPVILAEAFAAQAVGDDPCIVNVVDQRVLKPNPQFFSYSLTKAALHFATVTMAQALAPRVRVNALGPGPTLPSIHQTPQEFALEAALTPLQRRSSVEDLVRALLYLVDAHSVTGQTIAVDAGQHLAWKTPDIVAP